MAIGTMNLSELDIIKEVQDRLNVAESKLANIFEEYNIPDDVTDNKVKLRYALARIGDNQAKRKELREKFEKANKEVELTNQSIEEDFVNMTTLGNERIKTFSELIKQAEEDFEKQSAEILAKEKRAKTLEEEIKKLEEQRAELQGADGKGGKIAEEKAKSVKAKEEAKALAKKIAETEAKIKAIDDEIKALEDANKTTTDPEELKKNAEKINSLQGKKAKLLQNRNELSIQHQFKETEKSGYEQHIRNMQGEVLNLDSEIGVKSTEKNLIENELRLMPIVSGELDKLKEEFEKQKEEYIKTVEETEKTLNERGIKVKTKKLDDEPVVEEADEPVVSETKQPQEEKPKSKPEPNVNAPSNGQVFEQGAYAGDQNLPVISDAERKKMSFEYIVGYSDDGVGLSSNDRLKRIESGLGGRDYEAMVKAFAELKRSPVKLTRDEKNEIKKIMKIDKKNLAQTVKEIDVDKLGTLLKSVGMELDKSELESLHEKSFEDQKFWGRANNGFREYGEASYGILDGFTQMSSAKQAKWEEAIKSFADNKSNMTEEEIKDFEKYIVTPVKFGTLQAQAREVCQNPFMKLISKFKPDNGKMRDLRAAIAEVELPNGQDISSRSKAKNFAESLRGQIEPNPPVNERDPKGGEERNKDEI